MATLWQGLGAQVTLLARRRLITRLEPFADDLVAQSLSEAGAEVRTGVQVTALSRPEPEGPVTLTLDDGSELEADEVLFATGRTPATSDIGLDTVGPAPGSWLDVDTTCLVKGVDGDWLYALGDVNHRITTVDLDFNAAQGANLYTDGYRGHARLVVDVDREILLGATFVGPGVSELLHSATINICLIL